MGDTSTPVSWSAAEEYCQERFGTHLASIHSEADRLDSINVCKRAKGVDKCWIGLTDSGTQDDELQWKWSDSSSFDYQLGWADGEPTGDMVSVNEDCVYIAPEKAYGWNDFDCRGYWEVDKNIRVFSFLCNNPDYNPELECRCECDVCQIEGDPHITTFDKLLYHFMGNCSYLYVTPCFNNYQDLPIQISGSHTQCFPGRYDRTCLKEVYVNLYDSNNQIAAQLKLGENWLAEWTGVGNLNMNGNVQFGQTLRWNSNPPRDIQIIRSDNVIDVKFFWFDVINHEIMDVRIQVAKDFDPNGWGAFVDIWLAQCYAESSDVCGLCGLYNFNAADDFHYVDAQNNLVYISTEGVSEVKTVTLDAWTRTHEFGFKWLNLNIDNLENEQCIVEGQPPNEECELSVIEQYCIQFWEYECSCNDDTDYFTITWLQSCIWDTCSTCPDLNWVETSFDEAMVDGCFAFANITCINNCLPIDVQSLQPTYAPSNRPTPRPTPKPTMRPTYWPTSNPTKRPTYWPTNNPTNVPTSRPTPLPSKRPTPQPTPQPTPRPTPRPTNQPSPNPTPRPSPTPTLPPMETVVQADTTTQPPTINYWWHWVSKPTSKPTPKPTPTPRPTPRPTLPPLQTNPQAETTAESQYWWYWNSKGNNKNNKNNKNKGNGGN